MNNSRTEFSIAPMTAADFDEVLRLWEDTEGVGLNESDTPERLSAYLKRNPGMSFVARVQGKIVGAVLCGHDGRRGYLHHLAVTKTHRRQGTGRQLVETCLRKLDALGVLKCNIFLFADNADGELFWCRNGWISRTDLRVMQKVTAQNGA
jgi:putative acetyltransferase